MAIFSKLIERLRGTPSPRRAAKQGTRLVGFEPLEERRLLAVTAIPSDFKVTHVPGEETKLQFLSTDIYADDVTFEIQASTTGLNTPDVWRDFFESPTVDRFQEQIDAYRSYYYRIRALETGNTFSPWTVPVDSDTRPFNNPEDNTVKVSAIAHSQIDVPLIAATIELRWPEELAYRDADYTISRKEKDELSFTQVASLTWDGQNPITGWTDENLGSKTAYEYEVTRHRKEDDSVPPNFYFTFSNTATGYVYAGVDVPLDDPDSTIESPGTVILIVDNTQAAALATELDDDGDLDGEAVGRRGSIATQDLTSCSRAGKVRVVSKTPNCSWETAL